MYFQMVVSFLLWWPIALALTIPPYHAQRPLTPMSKLPLRTNQPASVILAFTQSAGQQVHHAEIPLRSRISPGANLPAHPDGMKIVAVVSETGQAVSMQELGKIRCRVMPKFSTAERAAMASADVERVWPWFTMREEMVSFRRAESRWFLGDRAVGTYECL